MASRRSASRRGLDTNQRYWSSGAVANKMHPRLGADLAASRNTLLLFNEAEDLFVSRSIAFDEPGVSSGVFIHRLLERMAVRLLWPADDISVLGLTVLRRMTTVAAVVAPFGRCAPRGVPTITREGKRCCGRLDAGRAAAFPATAASDRDHAAPWAEECLAGGMGGI